MARQGQRRCGAGETAGRIEIRGRQLVQGCAADVLGERPEAARGGRNVVCRQLGPVRPAQAELLTAGKIAALPALWANPLSGRIVQVGDGVFEPAYPLELDGQDVSLRVAPCPLHGMTIVATSTHADDRPGGQRHQLCKVRHGVADVVEVGAGVGTHARAVIEPRRGGQVVGTTDFIGGGNHRANRATAVRSLVAGGDAAHTHPGQRPERLGFLPEDRGACIVADGVAEDVVHGRVGADTLGHWADNDTKLHIGRGRIVIVGKERLPVPDDGRGRPEPCRRHLPRGIGQPLVSHHLGITAQKNIERWLRERRLPLNLLRVAEQGVYPATVHGTAVVPDRPLQVFQRNDRLAPVRHDVEHIRRSRQHTPGASPGRAPVDARGLRLQ